MRAAYESFLGLLPRRPAHRPDQFQPGQRRPLAGGPPPGARLPLLRGVAAERPDGATWRRLMDRSSGVGPAAPPAGREALVRGSIACYPPVWGTAAPGRSPAGPGRALRTVFPDRSGGHLPRRECLALRRRDAVLCDPYYPKHERLGRRGGNGAGLAPLRPALSGTSSSRARTPAGTTSPTKTEPSRSPPRACGPEPVGGALFARVVHAEGRVSVGVLDLTGSARGRWDEPTSPGRLRSVTVRILTGRPEQWSAAAAVLGAEDEHFVGRPSKVVPHRWGRAIEVELPVVEGWSVLRLSRS